MKSYNILRWDGIISSGNSNPHPCLYIKPDQNLLDLLNKTSQILIQIKDTNSPYDNKVAYASVSPSQIMGGYRPNFQMETGLLGVIPQLSWQGYPNSLGYIEIHEDFSIYEKEDDLSGLSENFQLEHVGLDQCFVQNFLMVMLILCFIWGIYVVMS